MAKYHSNSAYPPKFLVEFEAKYLPQIAPEAVHVSEHEFPGGGGGGGGGACPQTPLEVCLDIHQISGFAIVNPPPPPPPPNQKSRSALGKERFQIKS